MKPTRISLLFILLIMLTSRHVFAQSPQGKQFTIKGQMTGVRMDSVMLYYQDGNGRNLYQAKPIFDGLFLITDTITRPVPAVLIFKDIGEKLDENDYESRAKEVFLEPGLMVLKGDASKPPTLKLSGSKSEDELMQLDSLTGPVHDEMQPLYKAYKTEHDPEKAAVMATKFEPYEDKIKAISYQFFRMHPNSYVTLYKLTDFVNKENLDSTERIYNKFTPDLKLSIEGRYVAYQMSRMEAALPGNIAPGFTATDTAGHKLSLADYKGKYVLLDFWASWCPPCRQSDPHLVEIYKKYHSRGLNIIGIAWDDNTQQAWRQAIKDDGTGIWPNVLNGSGTQNDIGEKFAIHFVPTRILIDPTGKIIGRFGDNNAYTEQALDRMLTITFGK